jgi:hypothetical protein
MLDGSAQFLGVRVFAMPGGWDSGFPPAAAQYFPSAAAQPEPEAVPAAALPLISSAAR